MLRRRAIRVALLISIITIGGGPYASAQGSPDESAVREVVRQYVDARERADAAAIGALFTSDADQLTSSRGAAPTAVLLDPTGTVGKAYGATNTPHMYVIDTAGMLAYAGAIDDRPTSRKSDVQGAQNYVRAAIQAVGTGQAVKTPVTRAYGCTVKYQ